MTKSMAHPTDTQESKATQFARFLRPLTDAAAVNFDRLGPKKAISAVEGRADKLTEYMGLVLTALETGQILELHLPEKKTEPKLLELIKKVTTNATEKFVAADHFKKGTTKGVKIAWLGDNFTSHFLKKVEKNVPAGTLQVYTLLRASLDPQIITALGDTHETSLAEFWQLLAAQGNGEQGTLLVNGYANIIYIRDDDGILWAVNAYWRSDGWNVDASSVDYPDEWSDGYQVLSCDSEAKAA